MELNVFNSPVQLEILFPTIAARPGLSERGSWYTPLSVVAPCDRGLELERPAGPLGGSVCACAGTVAMGQPRRGLKPGGPPGAAAGHARAARAHSAAPAGKLRVRVAGLGHPLAPSSSHSASGLSRAQTRKPARGPAAGRLPARRRWVVLKTAGGTRRSTRRRMALYRRTHALTRMRAGDPAGWAGGPAAARQGRCPSPRLSWPGRRGARNAAHCVHCAGPICPKRACNPNQGHRYFSDSSPS